MEGNGLRRKDTTKGPPLAILSLDGGGVRGYSMLIILQECMHRLFVEHHGRAPRRDEIPKPCDHFDLIGGTGTGGLIAIMLGRLRLDIETCKEVYIRMTRKVFLTDKTFAGIPLKSTLFKASKLEEAIKECVTEHTAYSDEGNDRQDAPPANPASRTASRSGDGGPRRRGSNASIVSFSARSPSSIAKPQFVPSAWRGNPNALLYDGRENRTKTAVTAVYKGTTKDGQATLLRSYDSRAEPAPEFNCTIWQAGRATSAIGLAFKPIQIGQSQFIDEGVGKYNCSDLFLDEATVNEWPGREVGVFISVGNGKRPPGTGTNEHLWYEDFLGNVAEARKRLASKIEGTEATHQYMLTDKLISRGVNVENYYRFNVEVGVGEFGMNEWNRLAEISTGTRRYLGRHEVQGMSISAAAKLAKIALAKSRLEGRTRLGDVPEALYRPPENPLAVELPAEVPESAISNTISRGSNSSRISYESGESDRLTVPAARPLSHHEPLSSHYQDSRPHHDRHSSQHHTPRSSGEKLTPVPETRPMGPGAGRGNPSYKHETRLSISGRTAGSVPDADSFLVTAPTPAQYNNAGGAEKIAIMSLDEFPRIHEPNIRRPQTSAHPPPRPPKTPIPGDRPRPQSQSAQQGVALQSRGRVAPPYPDDDGPPPPVNKSRKPDWRGR